jgi:hypothetical protein
MPYAIRYPAHPDYKVRDCFVLVDSMTGEVVRRDAPLGQATVWHSTLMSLRKLQTCREPPDAFHLTGEVVEIETVVRVVRVVPEPEPVNGP